MSEKPLMGQYSLEETLVEQARRKSVLGRLLSNNAFGCWLSENCPKLLGNLVERERDEYNQRVKKLMNQMQRHGIAAGNSETVEKIVENQPDLCARDIAKIYVECEFDRIYRRVLSESGVDSNRFADLGNNLGTVKQELDNHPRRCGAEKEVRQRYDQVVAYKITAEVRNEVFDLLDDGCKTHDWTNLMLLLFKNYNKGLLRESIDRVMMAVNYRFQRDKDLQKCVLTYVLSLAETYGVVVAYDFSDYLSRHGLYFTDVEQWRGILDYQCLQGFLNRLWNKGESQKYLDMIDFMMAGQLLGKDFFQEKTNPEFVWQYYELAFKLFHGLIDDSSLLLKLNKEAIDEWGWQSKDLVGAESNNFNLHGRYTKLCEQLKKQEVGRIRKFYKQESRQRDYRE